MDILQDKISHNFSLLISTIEILGRISNDLFPLQWLMTLDIFLLSTHINLNMFQTLFQIRVSARVFGVFCHGPFLRFFDIWAHWGWDPADMLDPGSWAVWSRRWLLVSHWLCAICRGSAAPNRPIGCNTDKLTCPLQCFSGLCSQSFIAICQSSRSKWFIALLRDFRDWIRDFCMQSMCFTTPMVQFLMNMHVMLSA